MRVDARSGAAGVLIDQGTGQRIPLARWFDDETGEWEAFVPAPNGAVRLDDDGRPLLRRGRAKGRLVLVPVGKAKVLPAPERPALAEGLAVYQRVYFDVWRFRGEAKRCVGDRWREFLAKNDFLDCFVVRRRSG